MAEINVDDQSTGADNSLSSDSSSAGVSDTKSVDVTTSPTPVVDASTPVASSEASGSDSMSSSAVPPQDPMLNSATSSMPDSTSGPTPPVDTSMKSGLSDIDNPKPASKSKGVEDKVKAFKPKTGTANFLRLVLEVLLLAIIVILFMQNKTLSTDKTNLNNQISTLNTNTSKAVEAQSATTTEVGKLVPALAKDTPVIIDLTTANLTGQKSTLFTDAENGDQLLVYLTAEQAVVYRPTADKVISQGAINYTIPTATSSTSTSASTAKS